MPDVVIDNAIRALKKRRDEIDGIIQSLERVGGVTTHAAQPTLASKGKTGRKGKPMSEAAKARLRATYAKNHPGWKPKKK